MSDGWTPQRDAIEYVCGILNRTKPHAAMVLARLAADGEIRTRTDDGDAIAPAIWAQNLTIQWYLPSSGLELPRGRHILSGTIEFESGRLLALVTPEAKAETQTPPAKRTRKGVGGAPTQHGWDIIIREVIGRAYESPPKTIRPFALEIIKWFEGKFGADTAPDIDTLRKRIAIWLADVRTDKN